MSPTTIRSWRVASEQIKETHVPVLSPFLESKHKYIDHCWTTRAREYAIVILAESVERRARVLLGVVN
jgi:hypothetical protein